MSTKKRRGEPAKNRRRYAPRKQHQPPPKFVHLAVGKVLHEDSQVLTPLTSLFALDAEGGVWQYEFEHSMWVQLASKRNPNSFYDEDN